jgi:hypothetical protein
MNEGRKGWMRKIYFKEIKKRKKKKDSRYKKKKILKVVCNEN